MEDLLKEILYELKKKNNVSEDVKLTYTLKECSNISGIGLNTLQSEILKQNTDFPYFRIGKKIMVDRDLFHSWLKNISQAHNELRK